MNVIYKKCFEDDWKLISSIEKSVKNKLYHPIYKERDVKEYIRKSEVYVILKKKQPIGTISYEIKSQDHVYVDGLTTLPKFRGKGYASNALSWLLKKTSKYKTIDLITHPHNTPAILVYLKHGFVIDSWQANPFGDGEPRIRLIKNNLFNVKM